MNSLPSGTIPGAFHGLKLLSRGKSLQAEPRLLVCRGEIKVCFLIQTPAILSLPQSCQCKAGIQLDDIDCMMSLYFRLSTYVLSKSNLTSL
jgi:hypothetical protein